MINIFNANNAHTYIHTYNIFILSNEAWLVSWCWWTIMSPLVSFLLDFPFSKFKFLQSHIDNHYYKKVYLSIRVMEALQVCSARWVDQCLTPLWKK